MSFEVQSQRNEEIRAISEDKFELEKCGASKNKEAAHNSGVITSSASQGGGPYLVGDGPSPVELEIWHQQYAKSIKADDAETPIHLWDNRVWTRPHNKGLVQAHKDKYNKYPLSSIRLFLLRLWRIILRKSLVKFLQIKHGLRWWELGHKPKSVELNRDLAAGSECLWRAMGADWWEWKAGSRLFFWRWPLAHQVSARDGYMPYVLGELPAFKRPQPDETNADIRNKVAAKLQNVRDKQYITKGEVYSLTSYFCVPKGESDIRMVYDTTKSGLNKSLWAPNFGLPTVDVLVRNVSEQSWMGDLDIGEMFLNFCMHPDLQPYCGVDLRPYFQDECLENKTLWERWVRCMMGMKFSPYVCIKGLLIALELVQGDPSDEQNVFQWGKVVTNLPGDSGYSPSLPRLYKTKLNSEEFAALILSYVDDMRAADNSEEACWRVMHCVSTLLNYLGIQVASRKTRPPTQNPGAWAGSTVITNSLGVGVKATQEKWNKTKQLLDTLWSWLKNGDYLDRKELESMRGSLVYLQRTYPAITPYLKGFHLTIDSWRSNRNAEGWKVRDSSLSEEDCALQPPLEVRAVPRLRSDVLYLKQLFSATEPPVRYVRSTQINVALYGFGDASGAGFGRTIGNAQGVEFSHGLWGKDTEAASSNFRELHNLVTTLEEGVKSGKLLHSEVWIFTDNSTAESVFWKGHSSSPLLNELAFRLRQLEMGGQLKIQMVHVAGTRMISQGTDGLSRGEFTEGVMTGKSILEFIPLNQSALDRQPAILSWVQSWIPASNVNCLAIQDWFVKGHGTSKGMKNQDGVWMPGEISEGWFIWHPPPAIADIAVEELEISRHKRKHLNHIFIVPRLMTFAWRKKLQKVSDIVFAIPPGSRHFWPAHEHEPLIVGLTLRFSTSSPWQVKRGVKILELERSLREVWQFADGHERPFLREFCLSPQRMEGLPGCVVRNMLHAPRECQVLPT